MNPADELTWTRIQQKDGQEFERYYREHYTAFFLMACKYLRDAGLAAEIVNDIFMKLWLDGAEIQIEISLKAYIYRAVINRCLNALEKQKRDRENLREYQRLPEEKVLLTEMEDNELKIRLYKAIDELPEQCGKVFRMSRFEQLKQKEIAERLDISVKTVKNHITYALKRLNSALEECPL